jgi:hypothetical protein
LVGLTYNVGEYLICKKLIMKGTSLLIRKHACDLGLLLVESNVFFLV